MSKEKPQVVTDEDEEVYLNKEDTKKVEQAIEDNQNALPYISMSKLHKMGAMSPLALFGDMVFWQHKFKEEVPDVDEYVREKLGYNLMTSLADALYAEQVDAVALAIFQSEKNNALILADMAGIGKGRVIAAMMRYAHRQGKTPIFVTVSPNLFSDFYRDLRDIGGFGMNENGSTIMPYPLILNGAQESGQNDIIDLEDNPHSDIVGECDDFSEEMANKRAKKGGTQGNVIIHAQDMETIDKIVQSSNPKLPAKYNCLFLTYSQISGSSVKALRRKDFIKEVSKKAIMCFDEAHKASGTGSDVGLYFKELMPICGGVLFSSATFAKKANNMNVYAPKTDIKNSSLSPDLLLSLITKAGEQMSEYLSSALARSGQMVRRERSFKDCSVDYRYMQDTSKQELYAKYDKAVNQFNKLVAYTTSIPFLEAKENAVERYCLKHKLPYILSPRPSKRSGDEWDEWAEENDGRYYTKFYKAGDIVGNKFYFIETLLFGLKSAFVTGLAIDELKNKDVDYTTIDGEIKQSNHKVIIAVRSTLETIYDKLGLSIGDEVDDDFSLFLVGLAKSITVANLRLAKFSKDDVPETRKKKKSGENKKEKQKAKGEIVVEDFVIEDQDFKDKGKALRALIKDMESITLDIPISPIDKLIEGINSVPRPEWDRNIINPKRRNFKALEITSRNLMLRYNPDTGKYKILENNRIKNKATAFKMFNDGCADVLIINQSGATGASVHSSAKFKDKRPRTTLIHQVELDVNTEVQKRGRTFRTGMVNYPRYLYAVTQIPSEIRRLLMLMIKLRSLDANTTGNQMQNRKLAELKDKNGKPIEDFVNKYGFESLQKFLDDNVDYKQYYPSQEVIDMYGMMDSPETILNHFLRQLETASAFVQEIFYDSFNALYSNHIKNLNEEGMYDLETVIHDLKASVTNRAVCSINNNSSAFTESVWEEDNYVLQETKPLTKEQVEVESTKLCNGNPDYKEFHQKFLMDRAKYFDEVLLPKRLARFTNKASEGRTPEEKKRLQQEYDERIKFETDYEKKKFEEDTELYKILYPSKPVLIPEDKHLIERVFDNGKMTYLSPYIGAKLMGYKIINKSAPNLYTASNIEFVFAALDGKAIVRESPTKDNMDFFDAVLYFTLNKYPSDNYIQTRINNWFVDLNKREMARMLNGNLLDAYTRAKSQIEETTIIDEKPELRYKKKIEFLKYTTVDGDLKFGIRLYFRSSFEQLVPANVRVAMPINNEKVVENLKASENNSKHYNRQATIMFEKLSDGRIGLYILGGTSRSKAAEKEPAPDTPDSKLPKYYTRLFHDTGIEKIVQAAGKYFVQREISILKTKKSTTVMTKAMGIDLSQESHVELFMSLVNYIFKYSGDWIDISAKGDEDIFKQKDTFNPNKDMPTRADEMHDYKYALAPNFNALNIHTLVKLKDYNKDSKTVTTTSKLLFQEMYSYGLYPLEHTVNQMINDIYSALYQTEKMELDAMVNKMIVDGASNAEIGMATKKIIEKHGAYYYFVGRNRNIPQLGELFVHYYTGKEPEPKEPDSKESQPKEAPLPKIKTPDFSSADRYMQLFNYSIMD